MRDRYAVPVGISDHTIDNTTAIAAVALGACIVEKHVTMDRNGGGPDDSFSLEPGELENLCRDANLAWSALGRVDYDRKSSEIANLKFRRSLYFVKDMAAGEEITKENVKSIRPGLGLAPRHYSEILGKAVNKAVKAGTRVSFDLLEN